MEYNTQDLNHCDNLIKALKKGTFQLEGLEVIALAEAMRWLSKLNGIMAAAVTEAAKPAVTVAPVVPPVTPAPVSKTSRRK